MHTHTHTHDTHIHTQTHTHHNRLFHILLKLGVPLSRHIQSRKQVSNQTHDNGNIIRDNLGQVEISQCSHQYLHARADTDLNPYTYKSLLLSNLLKCKHTAYTVKNMCCAHIRMTARVLVITSYMFCAQAVYNGPQQATCLRSVELRLNLDPCLYLGYAHNCHNHKSNLALIQPRIPDPPTCPPGLRVFLYPPFSVHQRPQGRT